jgi:glucose/arabinose dehydrogenase
MKFIAVFAALVTLSAGGFQTTTSIHALVFTSGLQSPVAFVADPADPAVFYAVEQAGRIRVVRNRAIAEDLLDLRGRIAAGGERGLLGLVLAPDFTTSGRFFVNFTNTNGDTVVARFRRGSGGAADPASRFDLKWDNQGASVISQPFANHNGGNLAFGPDGYLYIGLGDGGSGDDPLRLAQNPSSLLGKMLRIDVAVDDSHPRGYVVPADNPFVGGTPVAARPEIWAFGLRNPWRYCFDTVSLGGTGAMVIGDVGQGAREEIDYEPRGRGGRNYGWPRREGTLEHLLDQTPAYQPLTNPIFDYGRSQGQSITGGYVYRGRSLGAGFRGRYFFADFIAGRVWSIGLVIGANGEATATGLIEHTAELGGTSQVGNVSAFGVDQSGELYVVSYSLGAVLRLFNEPPVPTGLRIVK